LEYKPETASSWTVVPVTTTTYTLTGLIPETTYSVRVQSDCGSGDLSVYAYDSFTTDTALVADPTVETLPATAVTSASAVLRGAIANPDQVVITSRGFEWKPVNSGYVTVNVTDNADTMSYTLTNLIPTYTYTYRAFIVFDGNTVYGNEVTFTTLPDDTPEPCETPTNLHASEFDAHSITIGWNANGNATGWNIRYRVENGDWNNATTTTNSYVMSGLAAETVYQIEVQSDCGGGNLSDWCASIHISTSYDGIASWLENSVSLYPNPAREVVNVQCTMNNVQLTGELSVFDVYGKLLQIVPITSDITPINVSGLANGMYFVRVTTEAGSVTKTFVKR
ncbi:MAG: fibronectin type III domain-containing protein, partial [Bacteroidales bacterium]|nr:fibronectin type III domain-containing protein [Bacteroidales bacterium]